MLLQRALRACSGKKLAEDGILGTETENAFSPMKSVFSLGLRRDGWYFRTIVEMNKDQQSVSGRMAKQGIQLGVQCGLERTQGDSFGITKGQDKPLKRAVAEGSF